MNVPVRWRQSPNIDPRPAGAAIDTIVLHYTGMQSGAAAIDRLCDPDPPTNIPVSAHYVVEEDGTLWQLVADEMRARHAGVSHWRGRDGLNDWSIGVEIVNPGHEWGYRRFPAAQIDRVIGLCQTLCDRHPIDQRNIVGHSDIAPHRKQDPGELFPWQALAAAGIGVWPQADHEEPWPAEQIRAGLIAVGYGGAASGPPDDELASVLQAFQRHWRPAEISGLADADTRRVLAAVIRHVGLFDTSAC